MRKMIALVMGLLMLFAVTTNALAYGTGTYSIGTSSTTTFMDGCPNSTYYNTGSDWMIEIACGNVSPTHRLVMKIQSGANTASSVWVYSTDSGKYHPYKVAYQSPGHLVRVWGRLDNRDSGYLEAAGAFYY